MSTSPRVGWKRRCNFRVGVTRRMFSAVEAVKYLASGNGVFNSICDLIIRPPRAEYDPEVDLGPNVFYIGDDDKERYVRTDLTLENMRGMEVKCSWFHRMHRERQPCVIYLHGNCGSRYDALEALFLLGHGFSVFAFDATGSGLSDGDVISLGFYERQDLAAVVDFLGSQKDVDNIGLWGRSMGAVTSIMYSAKDSSIGCMVCDSPFSTLRLLIIDLVKQHGSKHIPSSIVDKIVNRIRKRIADRAAFDIDDLNALKYASDCIVPTFIFHGSEDTFVLPKHSIAVCDSFKGSCLHHTVEGGHNDERGEDVCETIATFFTLYLIQKPQGMRERHENMASVTAPSAREEEETKREKKEGEATREISSEEKEEEELEALLNKVDDNDDKAPNNAANIAPLVPISFTKPDMRAVSPSTYVDDEEQ